MISKKWIINEVVPYIKKNGRMIEYYLILNLFDDYEEDIIRELQRYQNADGGFGHGLETDVLAPTSNVVSTDVAIHYLEDIKDFSKKEDMLKNMVRFYEETYNKSFKGWYLVDEQVDAFPRAIWWNSEGKADFGYGNPTPEIVGFLYQYKQYLNKIDIHQLLEHVINYINGPFYKHATDHCLMSVLLFYKRVDESIQKIVKKSITKTIDKLISTSKEDWGGYVCEPYKIIQSSEDLEYNKYKDILEENLRYHIDIFIKNGFVPINWSWNQFDDEFNHIGKPYGISKMTYHFIKQLLQNNLIIDE